METQSSKSVFICTLLLPKVVGPWDSVMKHPCISHCYGILLADRDSPWSLPSETCRVSAPELPMPAQSAVHGIADGLLAYG